MGAGPVVEHGPHAALLRLLGLVVRVAWKSVVSLLPNGAQTALGQCIPLLAAALGVPKVGPRIAGAVTSLFHKLATAPENLVRAVHVFLMFSLIRRSYS